MSLGRSVPFGRAVGLLVMFLASCGGSSSSGSSGGGSSSSGGSGGVPCTGDVLVNNADELAAFVARGCASVDGTLTIQQVTPTIIAIDLPLLREVSGDLGIVATIGSGASTTTLNLPALTTVGGRLSVINSSALTGMNLPLLQGTGAFDINNNARLTSLSAGALAHVTHFFSVTGNAALTTLTAPVLLSVGGNFTITGNASLPDCQATALKDRVAASTGGIGGTATVSGNNPAATCP